MEEDEFRATYHAVNQRRCVFEKALNTRRCECSRAARFCLAGRDGVACKSPAAHALCTALIATLRSNAKFALQLTRVDDALPHGKEIKIQHGGLLGLRDALGERGADDDRIQDIHALIDAGLKHYGDLNALPYGEVVKTIVAFKGRVRRMPDGH